MFKVVTLFALLLTSAIADININSYKLLAYEITSKDDLIIAKTDVMIYNEKYMLKAQKAVYDSKSGDIELFGDVNILINNKQFLKSEYIKLNLNSDQFCSSNIFIYNSDSDMWFKSKKTEITDDKYVIKDSIISSCNAKNPDWKITFSRGTYDEDKKFMSIYNPIFYAGDIPLFYLPYFGFSTDKKRRTGLLRPHTGYEESEGFLYVQPFFYAPEDNWDLQINPQIRFARGKGIYATLRFVDSMYSVGELRVGGFKDNDSFTKKQNLKNKTHSGLEFKYENSQVLTSFLKDTKFKDGLYVDFTHLNDIDYLNLQYDKKDVGSRLITSKLNYFITSKSDYFGLYLKYFIDTEKDNNDDTLQTLPSLQYHRFSQNLFSHEPLSKHILYSMDYKFKNNYANTGLKSVQQEFSVPINFSFSLFEDYLNFGISENLYYSRVNYFEKNSTISNANYFSNYHKLSLTSNLTKKYNDFLHNLQLDLNFIVPSVENKSGYFADFLHFSLERKSLNLKLNQYLYNLDGFDYFISRMKQTIYLDDSKREYGDFENDTIYKFSNGFEISNSLYYSHEYDKISKMQSGMFYKNDKYNLKLNHTYLNVAYTDDANFLSSRVDMDIDNKYSMFGSIDYDLLNTFTREWTFGWKMKKRCWHYDFAYKERITPGLTSFGTESFTKRGIYLTLRLLPIGGVSYKYEQESSMNESSPIKEYIHNEE